MNILKTPLAAVFSVCVCGGDMYENGFSSLNVRNASFRHLNASQVRACVPVLFVWLKGTFCPNSSFSIDRLLNGAFTVHLNVVR